MIRRFGKLGLQFENIVLPVVVLQEQFCQRNRPTSSLLGRLLLQISDHLRVRRVAVLGPLTIVNEKSITDENMQKRFEPSILMVGH